MKCKIFFMMVVIFLFMGVAEVVCAKSVSDVYTQSEAVVYEIKNLGFKVGEATITFHGETSINEKSAILITFLAEGIKFYDEEKIYLDPQTYLPIEVHRDLDIFGKKEKIYETYFHDKGQVQILKHVNGKKEEMFLTKKKNEIDNLYGFIYRYRKFGSFEVGDQLNLSLPTKDVLMELIKITEVKAAKKKYGAYYFRSTPKKFKVWFEQSERKLPLRIDGAFGFGKSSMVMKEYRNTLSPVAEE